MALALVMGLSQCKKENTNPSENNGLVLEGETYNITLTVNSGSDDAKHQVMPNDQSNIAPVKFVEGDEIYVAYNGKHAGVLTCTSLSSTEDQNGNKLGVFTGSITLGKDGDQPLHFFFLGNKKEHAGLEFTYSSGNATGYEINITDQTTSLPVISYAKSKQNFQSDVHNYTLDNANGNWLLNQCALVKFKSVNIYHNGTNSVDNNDDALFTTDKQITIYGVNNKMTIDLTNQVNDQYVPSFTPGRINDGEIKLNNTLKTSTEGDEVRYAIVLAGDYSDEQDLDVAFDYANDKYGFTGTYQIGKEVAINDYCNDAELRLVWHSGAFTISSTEYVVFSRGNLQYNNYYDKNESTKTKAWRFAKHQYDYVGGMVSYWDGIIMHNDGLRQGNVVLNENSGNCTPSNNGHWSQNEQVGNSTYQGWIDLYGWGTGNNPTKTGGSSSSYTWNEWGENYISNSGLTNSSENSSYWVTMTKDEWASFGNTLGASALTTKRMAYAAVAGVHGMIFLPDLCPIPTGWYDYSHESNTAGEDIDFSKNTYDATQWKTMEQNGAVFLPSSGYRGTLASEYDGGRADHQDVGQYWSSSISGVQEDTQSCYFVWGESFTGSHHMEFNGDRLRYYGFAVRLVHKGTISPGSKFFNKKD